MQVGDKIKIFPDTNINAYVDLIHNCGFNCYVSRGKTYIEIVAKRVKADRHLKETAKKISEAMYEKGLSEEKLAELVGLKSSYSVWNWTHGISSPSNDNKKKLKKILGVEI